jgi:hypothetical protein
MSRRTSPFRPAVVLGMLLVGSLAFLLFLYALGAGWTGQDDQNGGAHAASNSLTGYSALVRLLERRGFDVQLSRSEGRLDEEALLVLTPGLFADAEELTELIRQRRYNGPTLLVLPKWLEVPVPNDDRIEARDGWVVLADARQPEWFGKIEPFENVELSSGGTTGWSGLDLEGRLPDPQHAQAVTAQPETVLYPIVRDGEGDMLAGYWNQNGYFPVLADSAGQYFTTDEEDAQDAEIWPLVVVLEPDLLNNYGMADMARAQAAVALFEASMDGYDLPVVFDLTLPGLGASDNLLSLAFRPPFLAATLCLIAAALVIAWRGLRRFGPARAPVPAMAQGKRQLARNGAALIERARRWHLLGAPYAALVAARIARALNIREGETEAREAAIDAVMTQRGIAGERFSERAQVMRAAGRPAEMLRAASALRGIERMLTQ